MSIHTHIAIDIEGLIESYISYIYLSNFFFIVSVYYILNLKICIIKIIIGLKLIIYV